MITCQYCGAKSPTGASFCDGCGAALSNVAASQAQASAQAQLAAAHAARAQATAQQPTVHASATFGTGRLPPQTMLRNQYLIIKRIGQGGMAAVYQASDTRNNRVVAIKEMSQEDLTPEEQLEAVESFKREATLLKGLSHPNLPKVYENFPENSRHYLVMEFIDGETLEQKLEAAKGPLPEALVLGWARQLCDALGYLHRQSKPIIFRDLKPANVMVTKQGQVKLIDFGIARVFSPRRTRDTQALGTPGYAPPEQYGNAQTDARADIYALGATLYHLLTNYDVGRTPFALPPVRSRHSAISVRTAAAIERATQLNREARYSTTADFAQALGVAAPAGAKATGAHSAKAGPQAQTNQHRAQQWPKGAANNGARPTAGPAGGARPAPRGIIGATVETAVRAATAGAVAATAAAIQGQLHPSPTAKSPVVAFRDAAIAVARTATGPSAAPVAQPRELDFGQLRAGQDGSATLTITGQNGAAVSGTLRPLASWLHLDSTQFNGVSTLIRVTARTSAIAGSGPQRSAVEIASGSRREYIPVRLEIVPAPSAAPKPRPQPQPVAAGVGAAGQRPAPQAAPHAGRAAPRAAAAYAAPRRNPLAGLMRQSALLGGPRLLLSLVVALLLAFGLPLLVNAFALPQLTATLGSATWVAWALLALSVVGALIGAPLAYIGDAPAPGRLRTGALAAAVGGLLAVTFTTQWQLTSTWTQLLPGASQVGALALTAPLLVAVGAAIGAHALVSRSLLVVARFVASRYTLVLLTAAIAGGWLGLTFAQQGLSAIFAQTPVAISLLSGCGLVVGVALGIALAKPVGYLVHRFAFG